MEKNGKKTYSNNFLSWMESSQSIAAMRSGLLICMPFFIIGAFSSLFISFPIEAYQIWIKEACGGWIYHIVSWINNATVQMTTLLVILAIGYSYACRVDREEMGYYMLTSFSSYTLFAQDARQGFSFLIFDASWLFTGILVTLLSCFLYQRFRAVSQRLGRMNSRTGMDMDFNNAVMAILPITGVVFVWVLIKLLFVLTIGTSLQNIGCILVEKIFSVTGTGILGMITYILLSHILWFFGIHGGNVMSVADGLFQTGMLDNMAAAAAGGEATHILTKTLYDMTTIGGCGATLCLLNALLLNGKKKDKILFRIGILPALFNINEIILFGLPIVFNPVMIIPFTAVPLVLCGISALSMYLGLVPVPYTEVAWTTPVLLDGYLCTGSMAGVVLQIVLIVVGTAIYLPFVRISESYYARFLQGNVQCLKEEMMECEQQGERIDLKKGPRSKRDSVNVLTNALRTAIKNNEIMLYYQPQVTSEERVYGIEALLRWKHPAAGFLYPPLIIELARQGELLDELGIMIIEKAAKDLEYLAGKVNGPIHMAVNVSPAQFESEKFCPKVKEILGRYDFKECVMCFEITEQMALSTSKAVSDRIGELKDVGIPFHMDDFGMGHSSMRYLQNNEFEAVKLDGSLVRQMLDNNRSQNIISGIQQMASSLNYELIAEYVETEEQKSKLDELGCHIYQGYLYSCPVPLDELEPFLVKYKAYGKDSQKL